ncbi:MAG: FKBP-type peptidyl-prolyl cis-trans isomerase [Bacteroidetes bacterium]|nr:FKBP-type peptidyl-prolyl cis-trans isomerase [Bacteroidota bacterium]
MKSIVLRLTLLIPVLFMMSCDKSLSYAEQLDKDIEKIQQYLTDNNLNAESTDSGLHYIIENPGTGTQPSPTSTVTVTYKGYFPNGEVFDQSQPGQTVTFGLQQVIPGWTEGLQLFRKGDSGTLIIPSGLAYGPNGRNSIPGNAVLLFDIELINF